MKLHVSTCRQHPFNFYNLIKPNEHSRKLGAVNFVFKSQHPCSDRKGFVSKKYLETRDVLNHFDSRLCNEI